MDVEGCRRKLARSIEKLPWKPRQRMWDKCAAHIGSTSSAVQHSNMQAACRQRAGSMQTAHVGSTQADHGQIVWAVVWQVVRRVLADRASRWLADRASRWLADRASRWLADCCSEFEDFLEILEPMGHLKILWLNGTGCSEIEDFLEIWEPMGHLKVLLSNETAVKELPSSIKCLFALLRIGLKNCKRLVSLPPSICKLKSLKELDLTGCSEFENLPEILDPMGELEFLGLERTSVKGLLSSIGNLTGLQKLDLRFCKNLEFVPESIYNLNRLISLRFDCCLKLKKLPPFSVGLHSLEELNLSYCSTLEIPDHLLCLTSLRNLDLSGTMIKSVPNAWKHVMADAEPRIIQFALAVSKPEEEEKQIEVASDVELEKEIEDASDVELEEEIKVASDVELEEKIEIASDNYYSGRPSIIIVCPGHEIPNWFSYQNEGSAINIKFPPDWVDTDFLGFALSVVVGFDNYNVKGSLGFGCKSKFKANNGKICEYNCRMLVLYCHETNKGESNDYNFNSDHVFLWHSSFELVEGANFSPGFHNVTEASFDFNQVDGFKRPPIKDFQVQVKRCGLRLLYAKDT
ncbi:inactive disease resistance protein RPS4-like [Prunus avium]|uniref:Inactive disease resistance protein RPS4-like n=1 Tax=Prunus avium TaxID=42229 RepID=A0A6P5U421_PRUAV|nr:inactive disease resistance protein RPS4-like [Prunus avium]